MIVSCCKRLSSAEGNSVLSWYYPILSTGKVLRLIHSVNWQSTPSYPFCQLAKYSILSILSTGKVLHLIHSVNWQSTPSYPFCQLAKYSILSIMSTGKVLHLIHSVNWQSTPSYPFCQLAKCSILSIMSTGKGLAFSDGIGNVKSDRVCGGQCVRIWRTLSPAIPCYGVYTWGFYRLGVGFGKWHLLLFIYPLLQTVHFLSRTSAIG